MLTMKEKRIIKNQDFTGERALFMTNNAVLENVLFHDGESPLKESSDLLVNKCTFQWKYPLWYTNNVEVNETTLLETARSGIWYVNHLRMNNCLIEAPKTFRRSSNIELNNCQLPNALETFWRCQNIKLNNVNASGDYFMMNSSDVEIDNLVLNGNYFFDGGKNIVIKNSILNSKDSFWNVENATVINCKINGEYLGWNSKNLTFINCEISSLQGLCYIKGLKMINCKLLDTSLSFEYCEDIDAEIVDEIVSVKNPTSGTIKCNGVKELIIDEHSRATEDSFKLITK